MGIAKDRIKGIAINPVAALVLVAIVLVLLPLSVNFNSTGILSTGVAQAATLYEYYNTGDTNANFFSGAYWKAQTFTPSTAHRITSVKLKLYRVTVGSSPGPVTVSIRATDGSGLPTGADLCSGTADGNTLTTDSAGEWREITLGAGYGLIAGTKYAIVFRANQGDGSFIGARYNAVDPTYTGGNDESSSNSGSSWSSNAYDYMFEEWSEAITLLTFNSKYVVTSTTAATTTSTSLVDDTYANQTFSLTDSRTVLVIYQANSVNGATMPATGMRNAISVDGTDYANSWDSPAYANYCTRNTVFWIGTLASGSHTIKGRLASMTSDSTATVSNRVLLIYILNGNAFQYVDSSTTSTTSSTSFGNDAAASYTFTPSGSCRALILYNIANSGATENGLGKKAAINVGGTDYSQAEKAASDPDSVDSVFTLWALSLSASSTTVNGRFASSGGATVTINRRQLGILMFADTTLLDTVSSDTQVSTTSSSLVDDGQATIIRATTDSRELLVVAIGTKRYGTTASLYGECYGINVDTNDRANSRGSESFGQNTADSVGVAWAETLASGSHTIKGRFSINYQPGSDTARIDSRRIIALWLPTGQFNYRKQITILDGMTPNPSPCSANLSSFPVLISLSGNWLETVANDPVNGRIQNANGYDIIFRASDGITQLDHEIEKYDGTNGTLVAWVRIPTLPYTGDANIYMYYGNAAITSPTQNKTGVWSNNFREVWHLHETGGGTVTDSASSGYTGTVSGNATQGVAGKIGTAVEFDGSAGSRVALADGSMASNQIFTFSAWVRADTLSGQWEGIVTKGRDSDTDWEGLWIEDTNRITFGWELPAGNLDGSILSTDTWYYVVATYDGTNRRLYLNDALNAGPSAASHSSSIDENTLVGEDLRGSVLDGIIDEVRISTVARDLCWIQTEYNNQHNPGTFISLDSEGSAAPTFVKLKSFNATQYEQGVLLRWKTGYEVNNLGFHVYREENGQLTRLTPEPVAGSAFLAGKGTSLTAGRHYHWWDLSSPSAMNYQPLTVKYWLEDIDLSGKRTMHGPVTPIISREPIPEKFRPELLSEVGWRLNERYQQYWKARELREKLKTKNVNRYTLLGKASNFKTNNDSRATYSKRAPWFSGSEADLLTQQYLAGRTSVKLLVREEGWYRVTQPELVAAGLNPNVNPHFLHLYVDGREQPIRITGRRDGKFGPQDAIEFHGVGSDTPSTDTRVYWLIEGHRPGKRIDEFKGYSGSLGSLSPLSFPYAVEKKDRTLYFAALRNGEEENFFGPVVYMNQVDQILELQHLYRATSEDALLEVVLQGSTETPHRVKVLVNETEVGEIVFEGQRKGILKVEIPQAMLEEGENLVSLAAMGDDTDASLLDSIRLTYWHTYTADNDGLRFTAQGGRHLTVNGFGHSKIRVIDITDSDDVTEVFGKVELQKGSYVVNFRVPEHGERTLLALTEEKAKSPAEVVSNHPSSWHKERSGYDLVIISHRDFKDNLQPLKKLRESQALKVALIDIEDLYDEFSFGHKNPKAIKDFLAMARFRWQEPPRFVLLVGDASFDSRNYLGLGDMDYVPTRLMDTVYMETASDDWFVDFNGDGLPEMAIGRLPVQTKEEAAIVVSKIIGYEKSRKKREALLVADKNDQQDDFNFAGASEELRGLLPAYLMVRKIYRSQFSSDAQAKGELLNGINEGALLVNFIGHGSVESWRGSLLTLEDVESLVNGLRLPFFVNMTCLNGFFQNPYGETLAESLIKASGGGAIAIWTSSGLTEPDTQAVMNKELIKLLFGRTPLTLGEATARAKSSVTDLDIRRTWILFGDPTTRLK